MLTFDKAEASRQVLLTPQLKAISEQAKGWRRRLHQQPELQFKEHTTAAFVAAKLRSFGLEVHDGIAGTGIVAILQGDKGAGLSLGCRAELDALPIEEVTGVDYASITPGIMHACGHDGHMSMLLGAAAIMSECRDFAGRVVFIFQPAEEFGGGGARMIEDGLFEQFDCDEVYAIHNMPGMAFGSFGIFPGSVMASSDSWDVVVKGCGGHAAWPHVAVDPIVIGAELIGALQTIVSRSLDPVLAGVLTVTKFHAGTNYNVIPGDAALAGTLRALDENLRSRIIGRMHEICKGVAVAYNAEIELTVNDGYPVTVNHAAQCENAIAAAKAACGDECIDRNATPKMGTEDFSFMLQERPGCYVLFGAGEDAVPLHNGSYDFRDDLMDKGIGFWAALAGMRLADDPVAFLASG